MRLLRSVILGTLALTELGLSWLLEAMRYGRPVTAPVEDSSEIPSATFGNYAGRTYGRSSALPTNDWFARPSERAAPLQQSEPAV